MARRYLDVNSEAVHARISKLTPQERSYIDIVSSIREPSSLSIAAYRQRNYRVTAFSNSQRDVLIGARVVTSKLTSLRSDQPHRGHARKRRRLQKAAVWIPGRAKRLNKVLGGCCKTREERRSIFRNTIVVHWPSKEDE